MTCNPSENLLLPALLDRLIPPVDALPGAGGLGLQPELERMADQHIKYKGVIGTVLSSIEAIEASVEDSSRSAHDIDNAIRMLERSDKKIFDLFLELVYVAYYSDARVHERIGWRTGALQPEGHRMPPWDSSVLKTVSKRRSFWTQVD